MMDRPLPKFYRIQAYSDWDSDYAGKGLVVEDYQFEEFPHPLKIARMAGRTIKNGAGSLMIHGKVLPQPKALLGGSAKAWPPMLRPWRDGDPMAFREDVVQAIRDRELTGFKFAPVRICGKRPLRLWLRRRPQYYWLKATGNLDYYLRLYCKNEVPWRFCGEAKRLCDPSHRALFKNHGSLIERIMPLPDTWNGSDAIADDRSSLGSFFATLEFVELVFQMRWEGFVIQPVDATDSSWVDVLQRPWPPSLWYPDELPD
jgi:hypothetical protein